MAELLRLGDIGEVGLVVAPDQQRRELVHFEKPRPRSEAADAVR